MTDVTHAVRVTDERDRITRMIRSVDTNVGVVLARTELSVGDILGLKPGAVIPLPVKVGEPATVCVGGRDKYFGTVGNMGRRRAVRIEGVVSCEDGAENE